MSSKVITTPTTGLTDPTAKSNQTFSNYRIHPAAKAISAHEKKRATAPPKKGGARDKKFMPKNPKDSALAGIKAAILRPTAGTPNQGGPGGLIPE